MFRAFSVGKALNQIAGSSRFGKRWFSQKILVRYIDTVPMTLFRICGESRYVILKEYAVQIAKGSHRYDLTIGEDGLVHPAPLDDVYIGKNGASLLSAGVTMWETVSIRRGITNILEIPSGVKIPDGLVLLHEGADTYSLQCTKPMKRKALERLINEFTADFPFYSKEEYVKKYPLPHR
jgi:hypothetical protein